MKLQRKSHLQLKVLLGFTIALIVVGIAALINFTSLNRLNASVKTISQPDPKLIYIRQLLGGLADEESSVRTYALNHDSAYLEEYLRFSDSVQQTIAELKVLTLPDRKQGSITDSIQQLVIERESLFNLFIDKRKTAFAAQLNTTAVNSFPKNKKDESSQPAQSKEDSIEASLAATSMNDSISETTKNKGFFNKIKNIFSSSDKKKKNGENEKVTSSNLANDSLSKSAAIKEPDASKQAGLMDVNEILARQQNELNNQVKVWSTDELVLLQQDKIVMDKIREAVKLLEDDEEAIVRQQVRVANNVANNASLIITIIGIFGIISTLIFIYLILADISRSNRLKAQLIEARNRAEKLAKVKEEFLANMSHEIRTPLNSIVGYSELLSKQDGNEKQQRFVHAIQQSSDHLVSLVNQILDFSKIEAGKLIKEEVTFDFHDLIHEVYETFRIKASEKNILFSFKIDEDVPRFVSGDRMSVKQILINLVSNGIKFTAHGDVAMQCHTSGSDDKGVKIAIEVKDTGIGISPEMQEKIFEEFTQGESEITRKYGGTGLGLAISKKLAEFLHGTIELRSEVGVGSVFIVTIPFKKSDAPATDEKEAPAFENGNLKNKSVLIVDDEEMNVMLAQTILESWGMITDRAQNGKEALEKIQQRSYDIILLDIQMPEMSGVEVAGIIRTFEDETKKHIPIIALTANVFSGQLKNGSESVFNGVLIKPFRERELQEKMVNVLLSSENGISNESTAVPDDEEESGESGLFSLKYLEKTSGSNREFETKMLRSFIQNNRSHLLQLKQALTVNDWETIYRLAHKMIPQFRYLQIRSSEEKLKLLEHLTEQKKHLEKVPGLINEISLVTEEVLESLQEEVKKLDRGNGFSREVNHETVNNNHLT